MMENSELNLKPCPFCGNSEITSSQSDENEWFIGCYCGTGFTVEDTVVESAKDKAFRLWNTRPQQPDNSEVLLHIDVLRDQIENHLEFLGIADDEVELIKYITGLTKIRALIGGEG